MNDGNVNLDSAVLELRYLGYRIEQIHLLYRLLHSQRTTDASPSESSADVQASIHLFIEAISAEITRLLPQESALLYRYELLLCDLLIPAGDDVITEDLTRCRND